jgi:hypothetical protein
MKNLVIAGLVGSMLLVSAGSRAQGFSNSSYSGRIACQAGSQGYYEHSSTASWIVLPKGNGYYSGGELCANAQGLYGPCECLCYLNTQYSSYYVDSFGLVSETLSWHNCTNSEYCPSYFTDHVGGALYQGTWGALFQGTLLSDDNTADSGEPGAGFCSK